MELLLHIIIAFLSMVYTGYMYFVPSQTKLRVSYALMGLTLASGTYLVITAGSPLLKACLTGLVYLGFVFAGIISAQHKLARVAIKSEEKPSK